jgi:hypothetical protein
MLAPSVSAGSGITLGGSGFGAYTNTGVPAPPRMDSLSVVAGRIKLSVPHGSAALVTFGAG